MFFPVNSVFYEPWHLDGRGRRFVYVLLAAFLILTGTATAQTLAPFKDRLFAYPTLLAERDGGSWRSLDYRELRDINRRDQVPERRVQRKYVDLSVGKFERDLVFDTPAGRIQFASVGKADTAKIITVFIHGRGGDRTLGMSDWRFGGNFNRLKNLMVRNNGFYLVPDAGDFADADISKVSALISAHLELASGSKLVLACGSAGGTVCHRLAGDAKLMSRTAGIAFLGSFAATNYYSSAAYRTRVPVYIAHGGADSIFNVTDLEGFYTSLRDAGVPTQMARFETGGHGVPIRMVDWRSMINWMVSN